MPYHIVYWKSGYETDFSVKVPPEHDNMSKAAGFGTRLIHSPAPTSGRKGGNAIDKTLYN